MTTTVPPVPATAAWSSRRFRGFWYAQTISQFGDRITEIALPLLAVTMLAASPGEVGVLTALIWLPYLFGVFVGAWVDRHTHQRRLLIIADLIRAVVLLSLPVAYLFDLVTLPHLFTVAVLTGVGAVLFSMAYPSFFVTLVPSDAYVDANSKLSLSRAASFVAGPAVGGALVQILTAPLALVADALSFVASALLLHRIPTPHPSKPPPTRTSRTHPPPPRPASAFRSHPPPPRPPRVFRVRPPPIRPPRVPRSRRPATRPAPRLPESPAPGTSAGEPRPSAAVDAAPVPQTSESTARRIREGLTLLLGHRVLRAVLGCTTTVNFFTFIAGTLLILFASRELGLSAGAIGIAFGAGAVGGLAGAALAPRVTRTIGLGRTAIIGVVLFPAPLALMALADGPLTTKVALLAAAEFVSSAGVMLMDINLNALITKVTPDHARARIAGAYSTVNYGIRPLGALTGGWLGTTIGLRPTLALAGTAGICAAFWLMASPVRQITTLDSQSP